MIRHERYLRAIYHEGGRIWPELDCWGMYRLIVGETFGVWLEEFTGHAGPLAVARAARQHDGNGWIPVALGFEQEGDMVLMTGLIGSGIATTRAPTHMGCTLRPGLMLDIGSDTGAAVRAFRSTTTLRARPEVANRVVGIFRPLALAELVA